MRLFLVHGWSFDAGFWSGMRARCADAEIICAEQGYFGDAPDMTPPDGRYLAVGHSAGVLSLLTEAPSGCIGIAAINGFARFTADPPADPSLGAAQGRSPRVLARMKRALAQDPDAVVADFRARIEAAPPDRPVHGPRLQAGLERLGAADLRDAARGWGARLAWLGGTDDPLASPALARASFGPDAHGEILPGGHLLPIDQPEACARFLRAAWARLS